MAKGIVKFVIDRCKGCELCISVCPKQILKMHEEEINTMGYHPISIIDMEKCTGCANCALICPDGVISVYREEGVGK